ncbi:TetR/AcrR family transcriptional regulator [Streptomyces sp. NPDC017979]|uniref:TetR/AcrR family transcriptional regulator n=1 Tax=Streptomyces sp. NPDC017979 TaxID=3365024 RepID=UPI0037A4CFDB
MRSETSARTRNPWGEGDRLRGEILDAASRLLSGLDGEDALTIRGVARALGIAPASIYQHFSDRAALVQGLLEYEYERLGAAMREADARVGEADAVDRIRAQAHAYCSFALENPGLYRLMMNLGAQRAEADQRPEGGPLVELLDEFTLAFERCEQAGHRLGLPVRRAAGLVLVTAHGSVLLAQGNRARAAAVQQFVDEALSLIFI